MSGRDVHVVDREAAGHEGAERRADRHDRDRQPGALENPKAERLPDYYKDENKAFLKGANKTRSPYVYNKETLGFRLDSKKEISAFRYGDVAVVNDVDDFFDYC